MNHLTSRKWKCEKFMKNRRTTCIQKSSLELRWAQKTYLSSVSEFLYLIHSEVIWFKHTFLFNWKIYMYLFFQNWETNFHLFHSEDNFFYKVDNDNCKLSLKRTNMCLHIPKHCSKFIKRGQHIFSDNILLDKI